MFSETLAAAAQTQMDPHREESPLNQNIYQIFLTLSVQALGLNHLRYSCGHDFTLF